MDRFASRCHVVVLTALRRCAISRRSAPVGATASEDTRHRGDGMRPCLPSLS